MSDNQALVEFITTMNRLAISAEHICISLERIDVSLEGIDKTLKKIMSSSPEASGVEMANLVGNIFDIWSGRKGKK